MVKLAMLYIIFIVVLLLYFATNNKRGGGVTSSTYQGETYNYIFLIASNLIAVYFYYWAVVCLDQLRKSCLRK